MARYIEPHYDRDINRFIKEYKKALKEVTDRVVNMATLDYIDQQQTASLAGQIGQILKKLDNQSEVWVDEMIRRAYSEGQAETIIALTEAETLSEATQKASFSLLAKNTVDALIADTYQDLLYATRNTERKVKSLVREVFAEQMRIKSAQQLGRNTMRKAIIHDLTKKGLSKSISETGWVGIIDSAGRRWNLNTYSETVVRTKLQQAYIEGVRVEGLERGVDLAVISSHGATDPCMNYEGAIISMNGLTEGYPTYAELKASGEIFHPRCRHTISPIRSVDKLPEKVRIKAEEQTAKALKRMKK